MGKTFWLFVSLDLLHRGANHFKPFARSKNSTSFVPWAST
jgi:hypothetical protein